MSRSVPPEPAPRAKAKERPQRLRRRIARAAWAVIAFFAKLAFVLGVAAGALVLTTWRTVESEFEASEVDVPDVLGLTTDEATSLLEDGGLELYVEARRPHDGVEPGRIFFQDPLGGSRTRRNRHVKVVVSAGADEVAVPDLTGQSPRGATLSLGALDVELGDVVHVHSTQAKPDEIMAQEPPAGGVVDANGRVDLLVSLGPRPRTYVMPDLRGHRLRRVEGTLSVVGLAVAEVRREPSPGKAPDVVEAQFPPPGARVTPGTAVTLVVSAAAPEGPDARGGPGGRE